MGIGDWGMGGGGVGPIPHHQKPKNKHQKPKTKKKILKN